MEDQEKLIALLDSTIESLDAAATLEQKITHSRHKNYESLLSQVKWMRSKEKLLLVRQKTIGR